MLEPLKRTMQPGAGATTHTSTTGNALVAGWRNGLSVINLRGDAADAAFISAVSRALCLDLPTVPCSSTVDAIYRVVWLGPDDWFVIGPSGQATAIEASLRTALAGIHHAVTDVSGSYTVLHLAGRPVRDVLAQGCPLDLHPREFEPDASAGSHFFRAAIWLWQVDEVPVYEMLVRASFRDYVWLMVERSTAECGLVMRRFLP